MTNDEFNNSEFARDKYNNYPTGYQDTLNMTSIPGVSISSTLPPPSFTGGIDGQKLHNQFLELSTRKEDFNSQFLDFHIPSYGVQDFINERALWQKGIHNLSGEPAWFYFKIFFNFNDHKGLFGGILNNEIPLTSALRYLYGIRNYYGASNIKSRILSLARFTYTLAYINAISPWFFIGLNGVNKLNALNISEMTKEKSIDILCNGESIDMRLNTLLDMYKYACYDEINQKEVIPQNLRKFDMSIVIMNVPIKYFQTAMLCAIGDDVNLPSTRNKYINKVFDSINNVVSTINGSSQKFDYKSLQGLDNSVSNRLSFQMYELRNCEIDPQSFEGYVPSGMNNSQFFKQGNGSIKINYDRAYKVTFNEWSEMMYGTAGVYYDNNIDMFSNNYMNLLSNVFNATDFKKSNDTKINMQRINQIQRSINNTFFNKDTEAYKGLIDFSESVIQDSLINVRDPKYLGNIKYTDTASNGQYGETFEDQWENAWKNTKNKVKNFFKF